MKKVKGFARLLWEILTAMAAAIAARLGQAPAVPPPPPEDEADERAEAAAKVREDEREQARKADAEKAVRLSHGVALRRFARLMLAGDLAAAADEQGKLPPQWRAWSAGLDARQLRAVVSQRAAALVDHLEGHRVVEGLPPRDSIPAGELASRRRARERIRGMRASDDNPTPGPGYRAA